MLDFDLPPDKDTCYTDSFIPLINEGKTMHDMLNNLLGKNKQSLIFAFITCVFFFTSGHDYNFYVC